jgi:hypothetical protein
MFDKKKTNYRIDRLKIIVKESQATTTRFGLANESHQVVMTSVRHDRDRQF